MSELNDYYAIGQLIQYALRTNIRAANEPDYRLLIERYHDDRLFRTATDAVLEGLGLRPLRATILGLTVVPTNDSVFALKLEDYRSTTSADDRMIDGLIHIAILTTVFPRPQDLDEDSLFARPAVTIAEIDETIRAICERMAAVATTEPDILQSVQQAQLYEAWRVYNQRPAVKQTSDERISAKSTHGMIKYALEFLYKQGCFTHTNRHGQDAYQPTHRYQHLAQEYAATQIAVAVRDLMTEPRDHTEH
jgi:hypothetical protein